ncbi:DNA cytosine methyltransferase [uncultured Stenotrophomonas sp.]|uniref:DNA cytosine methyltransferase n=1 Tax=uncultured Stenotrophomonas sp. TaxID=165438 RepID=UPI0028D3AD3E|nr:DNA cytosine methyltransferase [uncultured Stenotrophomonas sp.]
MPALTGSNEVALAEPIVMRGNVGTGRTSDMRPASEPMPTVACSETLALAEPFLVPNFGESPGQTLRTHCIDDPMPTSTASGHVQLVQPGAELADQIEIDINYRMLHWRELARATSFDDEGEIYDFAGTATEITKQIGNAAPNRTAKALVESLMQEAA